MCMVLIHCEASYTIYIVPYAIYVGVSCSSCTSCTSSCSRIPISRTMRSSGVFFVLFFVVAALVLDKTDVDCKATTEKIEEEAAGEGKQAKWSGGGSESWAEWAKDKLNFKSADDQDSSNVNQDKAGCVKDKACESAEEAYEKTGEAKDKVEEKVCDMGKKLAEESKKRAAEAEDTLYWAGERAKEGYEAAKSKAEETYESGKEKLSHHQEL